MLTPAIGTSALPSVQRPAALSALIAEPQTPAGCLRFTTVLLCLCLFGQRLGLPLGAQTFSIAGPIGLAMGAWGLLRGTLVLDRGRTALWLATAALAMLGAAWHAMGANPFDAQPSTPSLIQFLSLCAFATLGFAAPVDESVFFGRIARLLAVVGALGIVQFALQFVGIRLFVFTGWLPDRLLIEQGFNLVIPTGIGATLKSNGFVLIEPSTFSQLMALGLMVEVLGARSPIRLAVFVGGLLVSFSGTGWIVLACFLPAASVQLGRRGVVLAFAAAALVIVAGALAAVIAPDLAGSFANRLSEISQPGTSGHLRFVTPFWLVSDVLARAPSALLAGIGAGLCEHLTMPYEYDVNTPIKILIEYGAPLLGTYLGLFWHAARTPTQSALFLPCMVLFLVAGGYQQFAPVMFPILLIVAVARLRPATAIATGGPRAA